MSRERTSIAERLRASGLRATAPRLAVLEWLDSHPHATAERVHQGVSQQIGTVSKQAIYDILAACVEIDMVRQIRPAGHSARFERRAGDNHHHLVCRCCARVEDTDCLVGEAPCMHPERDHGFAVDETEVVFWGLCADCQASRAPDLAIDSASTTDQTGLSGP